MEKVIACCGLNCATCDARIATVTNNDELRRKTAEIWGKQYNAPITPEMINCTGCTADGPKFHHCSVCEVRNCAKSKGFITCADCNDMEACKILKNIHQYVPDALDNLRNLN